MLLLVVVVLLLLSLLVSSCPVLLGQRNQEGRPPAAEG